MASNYYTHSTFAIVAGASLDRSGGKYVIPANIVVTALGSILFGLGTFGLGTFGSAEAGRLLQGAGAPFAFTGAACLASHGFSAAYLATAIGFTPMFGMIGGSAGQFAVGPMIHGVVAWQQFWSIAGAALLVVALVVLIATPSGHDACRARAGTSLLSMFKPYKTVLSNPQSYLCGLTAGLLFLPTTIGDMIWGVPVSIKPSPHLSSIEHFANALMAQGAAGLALFNRLLQADIDLVRMTLTDSLKLSSAAELRPPLLWTAILSGRTTASLATSSGVAIADGVVKCILAGADAVMATSAILRHGVGGMTVPRDGLHRWMEEREFACVADMRGVMSWARSRDRSVYTRADYLRILDRYSAA